MFQQFVFGQKEITFKSKETTLLLVDSVFETGYEIKWYEGPRMITYYDGLPSLAHAIERLEELAFAVR